MLPSLFISHGSPMLAATRRQRAGPCTPGGGLATPQGNRGDVRTLGKP